MQRNTLPVLAIATTLLAVHATAQSWQQVGSTSPAITPGIPQLLVASDAQGSLAYDELGSITHAYSGTTWAPLSMPSPPPSRVGATLVSNVSRIYLFGGAGGATNELWRFDRATSSWVLRQADTSVGGGPASVRLFCEAAPTVTNGPILFFGGADLTTSYMNETWEMIDAGFTFWSQKSTPAGLSARISHSMAQGPGSSIVLFGGEDSNQTVLGDTWIYQGGAWTQPAGSGPTASKATAMTYDPVRNMTVLINELGETWEWNGFSWRQVGATGAPAWYLEGIVYDTQAGAQGVIALDHNATGNSTDTYALTPSPASFNITLLNPSTCADSGILTLAPVNRDLPVLGTTFHMQVTGMDPTRVLVGAIEFSRNFSMPLSCGGCLLGISLGPSTATQLVPNVGGTGDWLLNIGSNPLLYNASIDVQGIVLHPSCTALTTSRGTIILGY